MFYGNNRNTISRKFLIDTKFTCCGTVVGLLGSFNHLELKRCCVLFSSGGHFGGWVLFQTDHLSLLGCIYKPVSEVHVPTVTSHDLIVPVTSPFPHLPVKVRGRLIRENMLKSKFSC